MERTKLNVKWDLWKSTHPGCLTQERRLKPGNTTKFLVHAAKGEASLRVMAKGQSCLCAWHMILKVPVQMETQASSRVPLLRNNVSFHSGDNKYKALTNGDGLVGSCRGIAARTWKLGMGCVTPACYSINWPQWLHQSFSLSQTRHNRVSCFLLLCSYCKHMEGAAYPSASFLDWTWMVQNLELVVKQRTSLAKTITKLDLGLPLLS